MKRIAIVLALLCAAALFAAAQTAGKSFLDSTDAYLGQKPPVDSAVRFILPVTPGAKAIERIAFSNDGKEIYFTEYGSGSRIVKRIAFAGGKWGEPTALFSGYMGPSLSPDGNTIYAEDGSQYCWFATRQTGSWSEPARLFSRTVKQHYPVVSNAGRMYVASTPVVGNKADVSLVVGAGPDATVQSLGAPLNSTDNGFDFFMSRDESYAIVVILNKGYGAGDLCLSLKKADGSWTKPENLGSSVNSIDWEYGPSASPDDKYLFFTRENGASVYWTRLDTLLAAMKKKLGISKER